MARLTEKYVQEAAVKWLAGHYEESKGAQAIVCESEVGVDSRTGLGSGRADGLAVAALPDGSVHVGSVEAKSSRTRLQVRPLYKDDKWLLHAVLAGVLGSIGAVYVGRAVGGLLRSWVFPVIAFLAVGFAFLAATWDLSYYRLVHAIDQVLRYPANEQWLALSTDVYNLLDAEQERVFRKYCHDRGVGLIRVSPGEKITPVEAPRSHPVPRGYDDFLACYVRGDSARSKLQHEVHKAKQKDANASEG
jgi:hypothetical protein